MTPIYRQYGYYRSSLCSDPQTAVNIRAKASCLIRFPAMIGHNRRMFTHAGFLHFVEHHDDPIRALTTELRAFGRVTDSLIVLPEAFNRGRPYSDSGACKFDLDSMSSALQDISREVGATFIVGLLDNP